MRIIRQPICRRIHPNRQRVLMYWPLVSTTRTFILVVAVSLWISVRLKVDISLAICRRSNTRRPILMMASLLSFLPGLTGTVHASSRYFIATDKSDCSIPVPISCRIASICSLSVFTKWAVRATIVMRIGPISNISERRGVSRIAQAIRIISSTAPMIRYSGAGRSKSTSLIDSTQRVYPVCETFSTYL